MLKCAREVDELVQLRSEMASLRAVAEDLRQKIIEAGGGESEKFRAVLVEIRAHTAYYNRYYQVRLIEKKAHR